jgi:AcrR family transcriptional regulator
MGDIARAAGLSRPSLYLLYPNKEALFRALAGRILQAGLAAAAAAWPEGAPAHPGIRDALVAKELPLFRLLKSSAHGDEILAANGRLLADLHVAHEQAFAAFLQGRLEAAGVADPEGRARLIAHALHGLKTANAGEEGFLADVDRLSRLAAA